MADKGDWLAVQRYLAAHNVKVERANENPASKSQRTEASASSSMTMDPSGLEPSLLYSHPTGPIIQGSHSPIDADNLSELLNQEKIKTQSYALQLKVYSESSDKWAAEKRDLNDTLRNKLEEINLLNVGAALEKDKYAKLAQVRDDLITKCNALVVQLSAAQPAPSSPIESQDLRVSDVPIELQLTIMETINGMSHELLIDFYDQHVSVPGPISPESPPPEDPASTTPAVTRSTADRARKTKSMTAMALILQSMTLLTSLKPVDGSKGDVFEVEKIVSLRHLDGAYEIKWKGYPSTGNTFEPKRNIHCIGMVNLFIGLITYQKLTRLTSEPHPRPRQISTRLQVLNLIRCQSPRLLTLLPRQLPWGAAPQ